MVYEIDADYSKQWLLPPSLDDWVPDDHPARFIKEFVETLDLDNLGFRKNNKHYGRKPYSPALLLKVWLYGWMCKIYSTRRLEWLCTENVAMMWLTGVAKPDHNTLWRFFKKNKGHIKELFKQVLQVALSADMIGFALHAVDGSKIIADATKDKLITKKHVDLILGHLDALSDESCKITEQQQKHENGQETTIPSELKDPRKLREFIKNQVSEIKKGKNITTTQAEKETLQKTQEEFKKQRIRYKNVTDPDARLMKGNKQKTFQYNAEIAVDEASGMIVGSSVVQDEYDTHQLVPTLDQVKNNTGRVADENVADAGYFSGIQLQEAEQKGYSVLVHEGQKKTAKAEAQDPFHKSQFIYDKAQDCYYCTFGGTLAYQRDVKQKEYYKSRLYRCCNVQECPHSDTCSPDKKGRSVRRTPFENSLLKQRERLKKEHNREVLKKRKFIVETLFGNIKHNYGFRRFTVRGLDAVNAQWNLLCSVVNLSKIYKKWKGEIPHKSTQIDTQTVVC